VGFRDSWDHRVSDDYVQVVPDLQLRYQGAAAYGSMHAVLRHPCDVNAPLTYLPALHPRHRLVPTRSNAPFGGRDRGELPRRAGSAAEGHRQSEEGPRRRCGRCGPRDGRGECGSDYQPDPDLPITHHSELRAWNKHMDRLVGPLDMQVDGLTLMSFTGDQRSPP
jgi:hypothetical protein